MYQTSYFLVSSDSGPRIPSQKEKRTKKKEKEKTLVFYLIFFWGYIGEQMRLIFWFIDPPFHETL